MKNVIYKIRNVINEHYYVGSTVDSRKRFWAHRKDLRLGVHSCIHLQRAWNKYGEDCFKFEVVQQVTSKEDLYPAEQKWLDEHFGKEYCYNVAAYADAPMRAASPELRQQLAEKTKAWQLEHGHPRQGAEWSQEDREKIRQSRTGKHAGSTHYRYGKTVSPEIRAKIGATQQGKSKGPGRKVSPEGMAKIRAAAEAGRYSHWKGRKHSKEAKAKMSKRLFALMPSGAEIHYHSITAARLHLEVAPTTIHRAIASGAPISKGKLVGWSFKYLDNPPNQA